MTLDEIQSLLNRKNIGLVPKFSFSYNNSSYEEVPLSLSGDFLNFIIDKEIIKVHFSEVDLLEINKATTPIRNLGLPILQEDPVQDCQRCNHVQKCWFASINNITLNLLTCRIKYGIKENSSLKIFFNMIHPKLQKSSNEYTNLVWADNYSYEENISEMKAAIYESIKIHYNISSVSYITSYLFGFPAGVVTRFIRNKINAGLKYYHLHHLTDDNYESIDNITSEYTYDDYIYAALDVINDGKTLTTSEYRVISFFLNASREDRHSIRMIDGLTKYLENNINLSKSEIRDNFKCAKEKLIEVINV